jgi:hypothetical protein
MYSVLASKVVFYRHHLYYAFNIFNIQRTVSFPNKNRLAETM